MGVCLHCASHGRNLTGDIELSLALGTCIAGDEGKTNSPDQSRESLFAIYHFASFDAVTSPNER